MKECTEKSQMRSVLLVRNRSSALGTFGDLWYGKNKRLETLELPWKNNERNISCIPLGKYIVIGKQSVKFGRCWELIDVPNREAILIHVGNFLSDTEGCILVGESSNSAQIFRSRAAMQRMREDLEWPNPFMLEIMEEPRECNETEERRDEAPHGNAESGKATEEGLAPSKTSEDES